MKLIAVDDIQLRCEHLPNPGAPALLLLNSLGTSLEMWDEQIDALRERYEIVRFDARGHGRSGATARTELSIGDLARDALAVLDGCGIARAHLCGLSLGGMIAMYIATHWPDRVLKLALCNTSAYMPPREAWQARIETVHTHGMAALIEGILERWFTPEFRLAHPDRVERVRAMLLETEPRSYAACAAAVRDMDQRESIRGIMAKTLVIAGTQDLATPSPHAELIRDTIPGAQLLVIDAAHLSNMEQPQAFNGALLGFLAA